MKTNEYGIEYYVQMTSCIRIDNPEVIPLLLHMRWYKQKASSDIHLRIMHPRCLDKHVNLFDSTYCRVLWDDVDDGDKVPYRKARLRLEGHSGFRGSGERLYALLELDFDNPITGKSIVLSPVPFGVNGKPTLSFRNEEEKGLLLFVAKFILGSDHDIIWNGRTLECELKKFSCLKKGIDLLPVNKLVALTEFDFLSPAVDGWKAKRSVKEFEEIFGVKLPDIWD
jgi:hypothetical protein